MNALLSFASALVALRLGGQLARRRRYAWAGGLFSFAAATAAMAWGSAHGWDARTFRVYYLAGALLSAPLLGVGSLQLAGRRWAAPLGLVYTGLAFGIAVAMPVHGTFGTDVPRAQDHVDALPRVVAIVGSSLGAVAVVIVAAATLRTQAPPGARCRRGGGRGRRRVCADPDRRRCRRGVLRPPRRSSTRRSARPSVSGAPCRPFRRP